jgi:predicted metal-dependent peptidase
MNQSTQQLDPATSELVSASLMRLSQRSAFLTALALFARFQASTALPTAATDGRDVFLNPEFFGRLQPGERDGLLLHEVLHAALLHVARRGGRDPQLWNIAADIVVNGIILREGYDLPPGGVVDRRLEKFSVEEVYELLLREAERRPPPAMADLIDAPPDAPQSATAADGAEGEQKRIADERYWQQARQQAEMQAPTMQPGTEPGGLQRELGRLRVPQLDWRSRLWRYLVQTPTDFAGFDRRFVGQGTYLETLDSQSLRVYVAVDTSGSINKAALELFVAEVQSIIRAYPHLRCELYYADMKLYGPYALTARSELPAPQGGGGTDFRPFFRALEQRADPHTASVAIYLTDGYGNFPRTPPRCPTLWVVTPGGRDLGGFPFGEAIRLLPSG